MKSSEHDQSLTSEQSIEYIFSVERTIRLRIDGTSIVRSAFKLIIIGRNVRSKSVLAVTSVIDDLSTILASSLVMIGTVPSRLPIQIRGGLELCWGSPTESSLSAKQAPFSPHVVMATTEL